jgi:hypothetical protein
MSNTNSNTPSYSVSIGASILGGVTNSASSSLNVGVDYASGSSQSDYTTYTTTTTNTTNVIYGQQVGGGWQWQQTGSTIWPYNPSTTQPIITITPGVISIPSVWPLPPKWPENLPDTIGLLYIKDGKLMMMTEEGVEVELLDLSTAEGETAQILIAIAAKKKLSEGTPAK